MKINHNMSAVITNSQLLRTESSLSESMEKLSSGLKINHAKDDPSGMAIANKMQAQIDGLDQASQNASNGTSVLQIADGALGETTNIIQRMRELSVQSANGTNSDSDREAIQDEIDSLKEEVDRISKDTEYNTKKLLDGSSDIRVYADKISRISTSDAVSPGIYSLEITAAEQATLLAKAGTKTAGTITAAEAGIISVNGSNVEILEGDDATAVYQKIRDAAEKGGVDVFTVDNSITSADRDTALNPSTGGYAASNTVYGFGDSLAFVSDEYGNSASVNIECSNAQLAAALGLDAADTTAGKEMGVTLDLNSEFGSQATAMTDGNRVKITDTNGFSISFLVDEGVGAGTPENIDINVTDIGTMTLQIGANENQTMEVRIPEISTNSLYLDTVDAGTEEGAGKALTTLDEALAVVSATRSKIGAYENRLEYAVNSLNESSENMTAAISRIQDVDMAKEMSTYTQYNVLDQAGVSVLSQANDLPQTVLQLLQ